MPAIPARLQHIEDRLQARREARRSVQPDRRLAADAVAFARERLHFEPDEWQQQVLRSSSKQILLCCARQSGKSVTCAALSLHRALYVAGSLILLLSRSLRQSAELFRKVRDFLSLLPVRPRLEEDNLLSVKFSNGSRIVSLPGKEENVRGFSGVDLIVIDEAARVLDALYYSLRPMVAVSGGRLICLSTPWGKRGFFYQEWVEGLDWEKVRIVAEQCPRISPAFLAEERRSMPRAWFDSEYNCLFGDTVDSVFAQADIDAAMSADVRPLFEVLH